MDTTVPGSFPAAPVWAAVRTWAAAEVSGLPPVVLAEQITELDRLIGCLTAQKLRRLAAFDAVEGGRGDGAVTTASWLRHRLHAGQREAAAEVRCARALAAAPECAAALAAGDIRPSHAAVLAPVLTKATGTLDPEQVAGLEQTLLALARAESVDRTRTAVRHAEHALDPDGTLAREHRDFDRRWLTVSVGEDGLAYLRGMLDRDGGAAVLTVLDALTPPPAPDDPRSPSQARADALVDGCTTLLRHGALPATAGHRPQLTLIADLAALRQQADTAGLPLPLAALGLAGPTRLDPAGPDSTGRCTAEQPTRPGPTGSAPDGSGRRTRPRPAGRARRPAAPPADPIARVATVGARLNWTGPVHPHTARRIACDATVTRLLLDPDGQPLHLGRARRLVSRAQWTALVTRDGGCLFPGCHRPPTWCDAHHIRHWADGGPTDLDNLVLLCRYHHRHVHEHDWTITRDLDGRYTVQPPHTTCAGEPRQRVPPEHRRGQHHRAVVAQQDPANVAKLQDDKKVAIKARIIHEGEIAFTGSVPGDNLVAQHDATAAQGARHPRGDRRAERRVQGTGTGRAPAVVVLTARDYPTVVADELTALGPPTGPVRRIGARGKAAQNLDAIREDIASVIRTPPGSRVADPVELSSDLALETSSLLYETGAPHPVWRRWATLAAFGMVLTGRCPEACPYLVLGGEWAGVAALGSPSSGTVAQQAVWMLATGDRSGLPDRVDEVDDPWLTLLDSVPAGDHTGTEGALRELAEFWLGEDEEWELFHPRSCPGFEPEVCAAAAVARHHGYTPRDLPPDTLRFLDPGLAVPEPAPLIPDLTPEPLT